jgi:hypothetical protein
MLGDGARSLTLGGQTWLEEMEQEHSCTVCGSRAGLKGVFSLVLFFGRTRV